MMKKFLLVFICALMAAQASAYADNIIVALRGTAIQDERRVPDIDGDGKKDSALCFDVNLVDLKTDEVIGAATDCLSNIQMDDCGGIKLVGTTFFHFPNGTLVTRGLTTVQPVLHGTSDFTHITGAIPAPGENSVLSGTSRFKRASGSVRLSGAVKMEPLADGRLRITFDCIFVINLN